MTDKDLGFDDWFRARRPAGENHLRPARVTAVDRDRRLILDPPNEVSAELTGALQFGSDGPEDLPAVGDWVLADFFNDETFALIHSVFPRKTLLMRKTAGKRIDFQLIAANLDIAFLVQSLDDNFNLPRLERYLVMANQGGIRPVILLSKCDLADPELRGRAVMNIKKRLGPTPIFICSPKTGEGISAVREVIRPGVTGCLLGSSGVGKTTLLNRLLGEERFAVRKVRAGDGKGRHATTRRQLTLLKGGGMLIDTPGMRELGNFAVEEGIGRTFPEIMKLASACRFRDCTHSDEPGCAVQTALREGRLDSARFNSWRKLVKESVRLEMSYAEKRDKDRKLGRFYRSVLKTHKHERS